MTGVQTCALPICNLSIYVSLFEDTFVASFAFAVIGSVGGNILVIPFFFSSTSPRKRINYKARNEYSECRCNIAVICRGFKMQPVKIVLLVQLLEEPSRTRFMYYLNSKKT